MWRFYSQLLLQREKSQGRMRSGFAAFFAITEKLESFNNWIWVGGSVSFALFKYHNSNKSVLFLKWKSNECKSPCDSYLGTKWWGLFFFDLIVQQSALKQNQSACFARGKREESGTTAAVANLVTNVLATIRLHQGCCYVHWRGSQHTLSNQSSKPLTGYQSRSVPAVFSPQIVYCLFIYLFFCFNSSYKALLLHSVQ